MFVKHTLLIIKKLCISHLSLLGKIKAVGNIYQSETLFISCL